MQEDFLDQLDLNVDRRIKKTKRALRLALFSLMEEKNIEQITIKEIAQLADVNRSTFYLYYNNVFDMYEKTQEEIFSLFEKIIIPFSFNVFDASSLADYLKRYLEFCKQNPNICKFVFRNSTNNQIAQKIKCSILTLAPDSHSAFSKNDPRHHLTTYMLYGVVFAVMEWVENGMQIEIDEFALFLADLYINGSLHAKKMTFGS